METIEHFAKISLVARLLGRENLLSREEVMRLQELRGTYGIKAPAPICAETEEDASCQVVQAPHGWVRHPQAAVPDPRSSRGGRGLAEGFGEGGCRGEIRLTYRELSALIEDAHTELTFDRLYGSRAG